MTYDELLADNTALRAQMVTLMGKLSAIEASNEALAQELARLKRQTFGVKSCLLYTSPSPRDRTRSRMPSSA